MRIKPLIQPLIYSKVSPTLVNRKKVMVKSPALLSPPKPKVISTPVNLDLTYGVHFSNPTKHDRFDKYNPIIVVGGNLDSSLIKTNFGDIDEEAGRIEREVFKSLKKGKTVCLLCNIDELSGKILKRAKIGFNTLARPDVDLIPCQTDFTNLITNFGSTKNTFLGDFEKIICKTADGETAGFSKKVYKGNLIYLPCYMKLRNFIKIPTLNEFIPQLTFALRKFQLRVQYEAPDWVDNFHFQKEVPINNKVADLKRELEQNCAILSNYAKIKEVLWFRDDDLIEPIINLFRLIGLNCSRDEKYKEDFWILNGKKQEIIVEVKALDKNIKRHHISQLDMHRGSRDKPDDFPAVLIVNSFNEAKSLKTKDKPISPAEINKAVQLKILILRTLDLCNAFSSYETGKLTLDKLFELLRNEHGWLKITSEGYNIVKK